MGPRNKRSAVPTSVGVDLQNFHSWNKFHIISESNYFKEIFKAPFAFTLRERMQKRNGNRNGNHFLARQNVWHRFTSVTTRLVTRGPLLSPRRSTLRRLKTSILNSSDDFDKLSYSAISTVKENYEDNDESLECNIFLNSLLTIYIWWYAWKTVSEWKFKIITDMKINQAEKVRKFTCFLGWNKL